MVRLDKIKRYQRASNNGPTLAIHQLSISFIDVTSIPVATNQICRKINCANKKIHHKPKQVATILPNVVGSSRKIEPNAQRMLNKRIVIFT